MGVNVKVEKAPKQKDVITAEAKLERDLRSCMRADSFMETSSNVSQRNVSETRYRQSRQSRG